MKEMFLFFLVTFVFTACKNLELGNVAASLNNSTSKTPSNGEREGQDENGSEPAPPALVSCQDYCQNVDLFRQKEDDGFNYLSFANFGHNGIGRCRGHALLTQKMTLLGLFSDGKRCDLKARPCLDKYRTIISNIRRFSFQKIPGFNNLKEFSAHPRIQPILRGIVAGTSHRYRGGKAYIADTSYETLNEQYFFEIKRRLDLGHLPYIGVYGPKTGRHGLVAYEETLKDGRNIICAKDPNVVLEEAERCDNYFYLEGEEIYYHRMGKERDLLTDFKITSDEDRRVKRYEKALMRKCLIRSRQQSLCK